MTRRVGAHWPQSAAVVVGLFVLGTLLDLSYAGRGYMPLDQSIVFDGGWRILSGQVPFRDFAPLTGLVPALIQALFFRAFGVTWFVYCLHAAVFNGWFCVLVWVLLRSRTAPPALAVLYAALSALVFYAPSGTPYMEQEAFFFVLAAVTLLYTARDAAPTRRRMSWTAAPFCIVLAFLSKQNVGALAVPCFVVAYAASLRSRRDRVSMITWTTCGAAVCAVVLAVSWMAWGVDPGKVRADLFEMPYRIGQERLANPNFRMVVWVHRLLSPAVLALSMLAAVVLYVTTSRDPSAHARRQALRASAMDFALLIALMTLSVTFIVTTANQPEGGFPFLFLALGILHTRALTIAPVLGVAKGWVTALLLAVATFDGARYAMLDAARGYQDIQFDSSAARQLASPALQFLQFQTGVPLSADGLDKIIAFLQPKPRNFLLIGDATILYGVTGKPSPPPYLWLHAGMTTEYFRTQRMESYQDELLANLRRDDVGYVVLENSQTYLNVSLAMWPRVEAFVNSHTRSTVDIGEFHVIELE